MAIRTNATPWPWPEKTILTQPAASFFFNMNDNDSLDPGRKWGYAVFGRVTEGMDVLDKIAAVETDVHETFGWPDVPVEPVILKKATILPPQF